LLDAVRDIAALLVVDNCEHVLDAAAPLVRDLLLSAAGLRVLATSRAPLGIAGEVTYAVEPLAVPQHACPPDELAHADAVRLFLDRARAARPDFAPGPDEIVAIAEICRRLDGLPLAIELVAPRVRAFSPQRLAEMVRGHLAAVTSPDPAAPARQRTLDATIGWSYELLDAGAQVLFARLAVFAGTFDYDAVLEICAHGDLDDHDAARSFPRLLDRSMISAVRVGGADTRYRLLETLRDFAGARWDERPDHEETAHRHGRHYLALAERAAPRLRGVEHDAWLARLEADGENLNAGITRAIAAGDAHTVARFVCALALFWEDCRPRREAIGWTRWLARHLAADVRDDDRPGDWVVAEALASSGQLLGSWDLDAALSCARGGVAASRGLGPWDRARALEALGWVRAYRDGAAAMPVLEQAYALFDEVGDTWHCARVTQAATPRGRCSTVPWPSSAASATCAAWAERRWNWRRSRLTRSGPTSVSICSTSASARRDASTTASPSRARGTCARPWRSATGTGRTAATADTGIGLDTGAQGALGRCRHAPYDRKDLSEMLIEPREGGPCLLFQLCGCRVACASSLSCPRRSCCLPRCLPVWPSVTARPSTRRHVTTAAGNAGGVTSRIPRWPSSIPCAGRPGRPTSTPCGTGTACTASRSAATTRV
jgi:predicted ATPase